jgi:uncharacterized protein with NRDE domain
MCLAVLACNAHERFRLIVVANRDEYHARPTAPAQLWFDQPQVLAGRDLRAGGTWLGLSATGKIGLLTNYREPDKQNLAAPSRGSLVSDYLTQDIDAQHYAQVINTHAQQFNGFNLLLADTNSAHYASNRIRNLNSKISDGVHGLSNATLDIAWPKVARTQLAVKQFLSDHQTPEANGLFEIFYDVTPATLSELPRTGLAPERELQLSSPFILDEVYGTRCSTVILIDRSGIAYFEERTFNNKGEIIHSVKWQLDSVKQIFTPLT